MFEQNNVGVQMKTPLAEYIEGVATGVVPADAATLSYIAEATTQILDNIDGTPCTYFHQLNNIYSNFYHMYTYIHFRRRNVLRRGRRGRRQ